MSEQLLKFLRASVTRTGLVLVREERLCDELGLDPALLRAALAALEAAGHVSVLSPLPFLVLAIKPRVWSGSSTTRTAKVPINSSVPAPLHIEVPVSSSSFAAAIQSREVGVAGEGEALLGEVLGALGPDADRDEFRAILARYSPSLVRRCLRRVMATKAIRVSRTALMRALLIKLSH